MADPRVIEALKRSAAKNRASPREILAAELATTVETHATNPTGGHLDSTGALQQRPSQGWGPVGESPEIDFDQFFAHAKAINRKGFKGSAGQLAQAVQRSAYPDRYDKARKEAAGYFGGGEPTAVAATAGGPNSRGPSVGSSPDLVSILNQAKEPAQQAPAAAPIPLPGFAAKAIMPEGYQPVQTTGAPQSAQGPDVGDLAAQVVATVDTSAPGGSQGATPTTGADVPTSGGGARVTIAKGANKPGTSLSPGLMKLLGELPFDPTVGTGTNHSTLTVNGKVSDHVSGNAADIPAAGKQLTTDLARSLATYAGGKTVQWMRNDGRTINVRVTPENVQTLAAAGGLFNVPYGKGRRIQVIGNTHIGGDHTNHLHVGVSALR